MTPLECAFGTFPAKEKYAPIPPRGTGQTSIVIVHKGGKFPSSKRQNFQENLTFQRLAIKL